MTLFRRLIDHIRSFFSNELQEMRDYIECLEKELDEFKKAAFLKELEEEKRICDLCKKATHLFRSIEGKITVCQDCDGK